MLLSRIQSRTITGQWYYSFYHLPVPRLVFTQCRFIVNKNILWTFILQDTALFAVFSSICTLTNLWTLLSRRSSLRLWLLQGLPGPRSRSTQAKQTKPLPAMAASERCDKQQQYSQSFHYFPLSCASSFIGTIPPSSISIHIWTTSVRNYSSSSIIIRHHLSRLIAIHHHPLSIYFHLSSSMIIHHRPPSSIHFHPYIFFLIMIYQHLLSSTIIDHPSSSIIIQQHPSWSIMNHHHPLSSIIIHYEPPSYIIHHHPPSFIHHLSPTFTNLALFWSLQFSCRMPASYISSGKTWSGTAIPPTSWSPETQEVVGSRWLIPMFLFPEENGCFVGVFFISSTRNRGGKWCIKVSFFKMRSNVETPNHLWNLWVFVRKTMDRPILTPSKLRFKPPETSFRHWWISVARCRWLGTNQYHQMGTLTENGISQKDTSSSFAINLQGLC